MTTLLYDRPTKTIGVDSRNTDGAGTTFTCNKIEKLKNNQYFLGSGHLLTIGMARRWAQSGFHDSFKPDFEVMFNPELKDDYSFSCLLISEDGTRTWLIDDEMEPTEIFDDIIGLGTGGMAARAARLAGATINKAIEIAIECDTNSGGPVRTLTIGVDNEKVFSGDSASFGCVAYSRG